jgi:hypothetical protein
MRGTALVGATEWFIKRYGNAAAHAVVAKLTPMHSSFVQPNTPLLGLLGARRYPYPFVGDMLRAMVSAVRANEDAFLRSYAAAGMDSTVDTVARVILRYLTTPTLIAKKSQEMWNVFNDAGRIEVTFLGDREYLAVMHDWPTHDTTVCKLCIEARRRVIERTGARNVEVTRTRCQAWGHPVCEHKISWSG